MNDHLRSSKSISWTDNVDMNVNVELDVDADAGADAAKFVEAVKALGDPSTGNEVA